MVILLVVDFTKQTIYFNHMKHKKTKSGSAKKRVRLGNVTSSDMPTDVHGYLSPTDILGTFDYTLIPGVSPFVSMTRLIEELVEDKITPSGLWLIRADQQVVSDEYGWVCIHWPSYLKRVLWHSDTYSYLRNKGCSVRSMQKMCLQGFEDAQDVIDGYKAALLRALPPGAVLEADNAFFQQLVGLLVQPEHYSFFDNNPLSASTGPWTFFRFGCLADDGGRGRYTNRFTNVLRSYAMLSDQLICQALENAPGDTPTLIMTLLTALKHARYSDGKGWQKWGIAWTRAGLVFNYRQAVNTISADTDLFNSLFKGVTRDPSADWLDPAYLLLRPPHRLPRLGKIARTDPRARKYIFEAIDPYYALFQDTDYSVTARRSVHGLDFQALFPINTTSNNILTYIETLAHYKNNTAPLPKKAYLDYLAPGSPEAKKYMRETAKLERRFAQDDKRELSDMKRTAKQPVDPAGKAPSRVVYVVGFNGYNLGCTLPAPTDLPTYPFNMAMVEYKGDNYFALPDNLVAAFPELLNVAFYDKTNVHASLVWGHGPGATWEPYVYAKSTGVVREYVASHFAEIQLRHFDIKRKPYAYTTEGVRYLHHSVFRPDGEFNAVAEAILNNRPELNPDHANLLTTFQTLWQWVYDITTVIAQGKVSEEFMYTVGRDTTHCPANRLLNSETKRLQYIIDKAIHARDAHVCDVPVSTNRSAPRSKDMNSYDDFAMWYAAHHEIAELPWKLTPEQQAEYICKRWLPWRRPPGLVKHLIKPHKEGTESFVGDQATQMPQILAHAQSTFGMSFTEY